MRLEDGIDGLVHISDLSWTSHVTHPSDVYKKGDDVDAMILSIDASNRKISLGIKQLANDPWDTVVNQYPSGTEVEGVISKITKFGAFVRLASGIEGLIHISEISNKDVARVEDYLTVGQNVKLKVLKVNKEDRKLGLSLRAITEPEETAKATAARSSQKT